MWLGACTSSIGTWMQKLAQSWLVYKLSDSSLYLGIDAFLGEIPIFLFSLVGGVFADRTSRRHLLLASQVVQMACAVILALLAGFGVVKVWHIWCLSFTVGLAQAFGGPAYSALLPSLVNRENLQNAIALNSIQFNLARVIGPMLGGIALEKFGAAWCFGLNGLSYVGAIISLLTIRANFIPEKSSESVLGSIKQGIRFIRHRPGMDALIVLAFLMTSLSLPLITFLPVFAKDIFRSGPETLTLFLSLSGAGSVAGAVLVAASNVQKQQSKTALVVLLILGFLIVSFGLSKSLPLSAVLLFCSGIALMIVFSLNITVVQNHASDQMRGRVMSVYNVAFRGGTPIGSLLAGYMMTLTSAPVVLATNGILLILVGAYFLLIHRKAAEL